MNYVQRFQSISAHRASNSGSALSNLLLTLNELSNATLASEDAEIGPQVTSLFVLHHVFYCI